MTSKRRFLVVVLTLVSVVGCDEGDQSASTGVAPAPPPPPAREPESIIGATTNEVLDAAKEVEKGAKVTGPREIEGSDPITVSTDAYLRIIGKTSILKIQHSIRLFQALHDRYPKDYAEFQKEIIKANGISLPRLPYNQKYGYDAESHSLVILQYPDKKQ